MSQRIDPDKMSQAELDSLYAQARRVTDRSARPLTAADRRLLRQMVRKGRPRVGAGAHRINITVERGLLGQADRYARRQGLSRAAVVEEGLRRVLAA